MLAKDEIITFTEVNKWYGEFHALKSINLSIHKGERLVICGPSGSGKSTLIRCINGLEEHQSGKIVVDGVVLDRSAEASYPYHFQAVRIRVS